MGEHADHLKKFLTWNEPRTVYSLHGKLDLEAGYSAMGSAVNKIREYMKTKHIGVAFELANQADAIARVEAELYAMGEGHPEVPRIRAALKGKD